MSRERGGDLHLYGKVYGDQLWNPNSTVVAYGGDTDTYAPGIGEDGALPFGGYVWGEPLLPNQYVTGDVPSVALSYVSESFNINDVFNFFLIYVAPQGPTGAFVEDIPVLENNWYWSTSDTAGSQGYWPPPTGNPQKSSAQISFPYANWYWTQVLSGG